MLLTFILLIILTIHFASENYGASGNVLPHPQLSQNQPRLFTALILVFGTEPQPSLLLLIPLKDPGRKW